MAWHLMRPQEEKKGKYYLHIRWKLRGCSLLATLNAHDLNQVMALPRILVILKWKIFFSGDGRTGVGRNIAVFFFFLSYCMLKGSEACIVIPSGVVDFFENYRYMILSRSPL